MKRNKVKSQIIFLYCLALLFCLIVSINFFAKKEVFQQFVVATIFLELVLAILTKSIFQPRFIITFVFLLNGLVGGANLLQRGAFVDYFNEYYHLLFYIVFTLGYLLIPNKRMRFKSHSSKTLADRFRLAQLLVAFGIFSILINWFQLGGIPIMYGEELRQSSSPFLSLIFFLGSISSIFLMIERNNKIVFLMLLLSFLTGFRSTSMILLMIIFFYHLFFNIKFSYRRKVLFSFIGIILFIMINMIKFYRDISYYGMDRFVEIAEKQGASTSIYTLPLLPMINTVIEGPSVFQKIRNNFSEEYGYGKYYLETLTAFLPGSQRGYGDIFNNITKAPTKNTKTATILSAPYIEFGVIGIIVFGFLVGATIKGAYCWVSITESKTSQIFFCNYLTWLILWIHTGYVFSLVFIAMSVLLLIFKEGDRSY